MTANRNFEYIKLQVLRLILYPAGESYVAEVLSELQGSHSDTTHQHVESYSQTDVQTTWHKFSFTSNACLTDLLPHLVTVSSPLRLKVHLCWLSVVRVAWISANGLQALSWRQGCGLLIRCGLEHSCLWGGWVRGRKSKRSRRPGWSHRRQVHWSRCSSETPAFSGGLKWNKTKDVSHVSYTPYAIKHLLVVEHSMMLVLLAESLKYNLM